ncbi:MAG: DUF881 domain-containing protein [Actinomycetota bacterium]
MGTPEAPPGDGRTRLAFAGSLVLLAFILVVSAQTDRGSGVERVGRRVELVELIAAEQRRTAELEGQVDELSAQVAAQEERVAVGARELEHLQDSVDELGLAAGVVDVAGPGAIVRLDDAIGTWDGSGDPNDYVIHEEDLQAVANALFSGGAEAMAINGERVLATSAIRCVGTTLRLNGRFFTPPFEIAAIGHPADLTGALDDDASVRAFTEAADDFGLGFEVETEGRLRVAGQSPAAVREAAMGRGR